MSAKASSSPHELSPEELRWRCDPAVFPFETTAELAGSPIHIIGQDRARESLLLGLNVRAEGYNIFATGEVGGGRSTTVRRMLGEIELGEESPCDLVFVRDFQNPDQPHQLSFPAGRGSECALPCSSTTFAACGTSAHSSARPPPAASRDSC